MEGINFIESKFEMPVEGNNILVRNELIQNIIRNSRTKLIIINAPGGFGKTILAAQLVKAYKYPYIWYQLDEADNDPIIFYHYLFHALSKYISEKEKKTSPVFSSQENGRINPFHIAAFFINEIKEVSTPIIIVFDDLHLLYDPGILDFLNIVLKYLPDNLLFIFSSRMNPKLDTIKLITSGLAVELRKNDIRFSYEDFLKLLQIHNQIVLSELGPDNLKVIYERSEGWILLLCLSMKILQKSDSDGKDALNLLKTEEPFFQYYFAQIFNELTNDEKNFLLKTSVLDKMTADACAYVSGNMNSKELLQNLAYEKNLLTVRNGIEKCFSCHQMLRDFLLEKLGDKADELYKKAGDYYFHMENYEEALEYYIRGKESFKAAKALRFAGVDMIRSGGIKTVERWLRYFDENNCEKQQEVILIKAFVSLYKGSFDISEEYLLELKNVYSDKISFENYNIEQVIWSRILLYRYSLKECIECADRIIGNKKYTDYDTTYEAYMNKAYGQILMGDFDDSIITLDTGIEQMKCSNCRRLAEFLERYLLVPYFLKFQYKDALQYGEMAVEMTDEEINLTERYSIDLYRARLYRDLGRLQEAKELMDKILKRKHALGYEEDVFAVYYQYATLLRDMGDTGQALRYAVLSEKLFLSGGSNMEFSYLLKALKALILSDMGKNREAMQMVTDALSNLLEGSSRFMLEVAYHSAGIIAIRNGLTSKAEQFLKTGYEMSQQASLKSMVPVCAGLLVHIYVCSNRKMAVDMAHISLTGCAQQNYIQIYLTDPEMDDCIAVGFACGFEVVFLTDIISRLDKKRINNILRLLVLFGENDSVMDYTQLIIKNCKSFQESFKAFNLNLICGEEVILKSFLKAAGEKKLFDNNVPKMIGRCFGQFQIYYYPYDGNILKWRTQKAKELMAYFLHNAGQEIRTENILADLWPDTEVDKARNLFYTNMSLVRKVMDKIGLKEDLIKVQSGYILKKEHILCDEWLIGEYIKKRKNDSGGILKILQKDYLTEFYSEWVIDIRNYYTNYLMNS